MMIRAWSGHAGSPQSSRNIERADEAAGVDDDVDEVLADAGQAWQ